jgi:aspartyl aminopeptidase
MKEQKKDIYSHTVRIPKILSHCRKDQICVAIYHLSNELFDVNSLKKKVQEEKYSNLCQIKVPLEPRFEKLLQFICKEEKLTVKDVITYSLILEEENPMFYEIKKCTKNSD